MALTLEMPPELENRLMEQARRSGLPVEEYLLEVLEDATAPNCATQKWLQSFDEWSDAIEAAPDARAQAGLPPLGDTSRSTVPDIYGYGEREDAQL